MEDGENALRNAGRRSECEKIPLPVMVCARADGDRKKEDVGMVANIGTHDKELSVLSGVMVT